MAAMGIESVLDLRAEGQHDQTQLDVARLRYHRLPVEEFQPPTLGQITDGTAWALGEMAAGRAVLVHCRLGMSRSVCMRRKDGRWCASLSRKLRAAQGGATTGCR